MNLYLIFISFFVCFFINYSNSACMDDSSPISSPRRPKLVERVKSPDNLGAQAMDCGDSALKPRNLLRDLEGFDEDSDVDSPELRHISDDSPKAMLMQFEERPEMRIQVIVKRGLKRAGDKLESYPKRFFSETGDVIQKLHATEKPSTEKPFLYKTRSISTSPKRAPRSKKYRPRTP